MVAVKFSETSQGMAMAEEDSLSTLGRQIGTTLSEANRRLGEGASQQELLASIDRLSDLKKQLDDAIARDPSLNTGNGKELMQHILRRYGFPMREPDAPDENEDGSRG